MVSPVKVEVIEEKLKPSVPIGDIGEDVFGKKPAFHLIPTFPRQAGGLGWG